MKLEGYPKNIALRDGTAVTVRLQSADDAISLHTFYLALPEEDRLFLDDDVTRPEWIVRFIARSDFDRIVPLVAEIGGKIVGHGWLTCAKFGWMKHVGQMRLVVARDFQRRGLGSALAREILRVAVNLGLEKMTARLMDNQATAIKAFERIGFRPISTLRGYVKDVNGRPRNLVIMGNDILQIWVAMDTLVSDMPPTREMLGG